MDLVKEARLYHILEVSIEEPVFEHLLYIYITLSLISTHFSI